MTFVSYAQNFEDVMLWRALQHVQDGFYIDVGAAWPDEDSVTKAFYMHGWCGINVEPNPDLCASLCMSRPRDINLQLAIGEHEGVRSFAIIEGTGLSTLDPAIAEAHAREGYAGTTRPVETRPLDSVWAEHVPVGKAVHFLKVDVEGHEKAVLLSNDWGRFRPWVVVVEATRPMSQEQSYEDWEPILCAANYVMVYFDGLNRFYVAKEHSELVPAFQIPPNVFDGFVLAKQCVLEDRVRVAELRADEVEALYLSTIASRSWRITAPLRAIGRVLRRLVRVGL